MDPGSRKAWAEHYTNNIVLNSDLCRVKPTPVKFLFHYRKQVVCSVL